MSLDEFVPPKLSDVIETAFIEDEKLDDELSDFFIELRFCESGVQPTDQPRMAAGSQDPTLCRFAMLRKTIHVISTGNQPESNSKAAACPPAHKA